MRWVLLTLATSVAFVCASHAQPPASSLRFGPFEFGMTVEEARGAAPNASWREDDVSRATGRAFSIGAEDVLELAGRRYGIAIREGYHGAAGLELRSSETASGLGECRDRAVALVAEVEHRSGRLGASQYSFEPVEPSPYEATLATPRQSRARMSVRMLNGEDRPANDLADPLIQEYALATFASVGEAPYEIRVAITASYDRRRDGECSILAQFERDGAGPLSPVMTLARARVVNAPTIASRHYMTSHARPQVTTATDMFFTCFVARSDGRVLACATRLPTRNTARASARKGLCSTCQ